jgi:hypothetical protein
MKYEFRRVRRTPEAGQLVLRRKGLVPEKADLCPQSAEPYVGSRVINDFTLQLDDFGRRQLERFARRRRGSQSAAVRAASLYYFSDRHTQRPAWRVPPFSSGRVRASGVRIRLDDNTCRVLAEEADRQGVPPGTLAAHALLYFLADLDRDGRASWR